MDTIQFTLPPWLQLLLLVLFAASEALGSTSLVAPNSIVGVVVATVRAIGVRVKGAPPTALLLAALSLSACHLGPRGRAAVATTTIIRTLDAACTAFLADDGTAYVDGAVTACAPVADPVGCFNGKVAARERAIGACRVYGAARQAGSGDWAALGNEARGALSAIGVRP